MKDFRVEFETYEGKQYVENVIAQDEVEAIDIVMEKHKEKNILDIKVV